jgi:hypothetical protein
VSIRKLLLFVFSVAMFVGGLYLLAVGLLFTGHFYIRPGIVGAVLTALGLYLLWANFIAPWFGIRGQR